MKRTRLVRLLSILAIAAVVVSMAPPALSSDAYSNREEVTAPLSERAQAADMVRLAADESLHAAMLGARKDWQSSEGLPVLDAPDPLPLDAPLTATWALTTPLAVEAMGGDFVASQSGPGEATPLSPPPMTGYEQTAGATYTYFQKISATDQLGRLSSVKDYMGTVGNNPGAACPAPAWAASPNGTTSYQYDVADRLTMTTAPDNAQIQISYDALGRKTQMSDPDMGTWSYAYDQVSNLTRQTDARGQTVCFYYDGLNRLRGKHTRNDTSCPTWASNPSLAAQYTYDAGSNGIGRRTGMTDGSGSASWVYDNRGRVTSETKVVSGTGGGTFITQWTAYDAMDRVRTMQYPDGEVVTLSYTSQGPLKGVSGTSVYVGDTLYNALGQATDRYLGSATGQVRQKYTYTQAENFRLTALQSGTSAGSYTNLQNITYSYDDQGNVLSITDAAAFGGSQTQTFTYDALNRLVTAQASGGSNGVYTVRSYNYTNAGNISSFEGATLGYNDAAHKHAVTHVNNVQKYWYDQNGNATRRVNGTQDIILAHDVENHVTSITGSGINATYVYDGDGTRVKATVGSTTTVYIGNYYERDSGTTVRKYYYAGAVRVALRTGGNTFYLLNDHLTSTAITTNSSGARLTELRYFAYGGTRYDAGAQLTLYRYTGQRVESGTGLYDYGARWYDPLIGRFLSADSIVPNPGDSQALNRYMYVAGNPLRFVDPSGHDPLDAAWVAAFRTAHDGRDPTDEDRLYRLYSLTYTGPISGSYFWSTADWQAANLNWNSVLGSTTGRESVEDFASAVGRLAEHYYDHETTEFVSGIALLFAGVAYNPGNFAAFAEQGLGIGGGGRFLRFANHGMEGFRPAFYSVDTNGAPLENTHHYAGHLLSGFSIGSRANDLFTVVREGAQSIRRDPLSVDLDVADVYMGWVAGEHGALLAAGLSPRGLPALILRDLGWPAGGGGSSRFH
jgi:RHS repeat-associated protein